MQTLSTQDQMALQSVLDQIKMTPAQVPNAQANALINQAIGNRSDALYLLVQIIAFKDAQLQQAQQQMMQMQQMMQQPQQAQRGGVGSLFGFGGGRPVQQPMMPNQQMPYGQQSGMFGGGSFLGNVATTAAGVVAGNALFSGLGALFGGGDDGDGGDDSSSDEGGF